MSRQVGAGTGEGGRVSPPPPSHPHLVPPSAMLERILAELSLSPDPAYLGAIAAVRAAIIASTPLPPVSPGPTVSLAHPFSPPLIMSTSTLTTSMHHTQIMSTFSQVTPSPDQGFHSGMSSSQLLVGSPELAPTLVSGASSCPTPPLPTPIGSPLFLPGEIFYSPPVGEVGGHQVDGEIDSDSAGGSESEPDTPPDESDSDVSAITLSGNYFLFIFLILIIYFFLFRF
jgi:hypothetical protein